MEILTEQGRVPMKIWRGNLELDQAALTQIRNVASLPIVGPHIAVMPDYHVGIGCTIGTVVPTVGAIIPSCAGVDLGCGLQAVQTDVNANDLNLPALFRQIEAAIPVGGPGVKGSWQAKEFGEVPHDVVAHWMRLEVDWRALVARHPKLQGTTYTQLGTLGTGNHFIEVTVERGTPNVWVVLHSGSRGLGNRIGQYFITQAYEAHLRDPERVTLPDRALAWLTEGTPIFTDYVAGLRLAQEFAMLNRVNMMYRLLRVLSDHLGKEVKTEGHVISCHHNYVAREVHFGRECWVTRKGAISAKDGEYGVIPGSMGKQALTYIVRGKGNAESLTSSSHGAGRRLSRSQAKREITLDEHVSATDGVVCRKDAGVLDESPSAYKDIVEVMAAQTDLVTVAFELDKVLCVKG